MDPAVVTRFAPSPTGDLHPGNARTALFSFLLARSLGGRFVLRVEDTDRERGSDEFIAAQIADLAWLDLPWDAGPGRDDGRGPYRQSERSHLYAGFFERLEREGLAYPCFCTPAELDVARRQQLAAGAGAALPGHMQKSQRIRACGAHARPDARLRCALRSRRPSRSSSTTSCAARSRWRRHRSATSWCDAPTVAPCSSSATPWMTR